MSNMQTSKYTKVQLRMRNQVYMKEKKNLQLEAPEKDRENSNWQQYTTHILYCLLFQRVSNFYCMYTCIIFNQMLYNVIHGMCSHTCTQTMSMLSIHSGVIDYREILRTEYNITSSTFYAYKIIMELFQTSHRNLLLQFACLIVLPQVSMQLITICYFKQYRLF